MVLTKDELLAALASEVRIWLHLISKVDPEKLDYRPTPKQRSLLELLQYMTIMGPIHMPAVLADTFDMEAWGNSWQTGQAAAKVMNLEEVTDAIAKQPALFEELLAGCSDERLRGETEMFGHKASRGSLLVFLVLNHYSAYRMQLFLYLKLCGGEELGTMNLWAGMDSRPR